MCQQSRRRIKHFHPRSPEHCLQRDRSGDREQRNLGGQGRAEGHAGKARRLAEDFCGGGHQRGAQNQPGKDRRGAGQNQPRPARVGKKRNNAVSLSIGQEAAIENPKVQQGMVEDDQQNGDALGAVEPFDSFSRHDEIRPLENSLLKTLAALCQIPGLKLH